MTWTYGNDGTWLAETQDGFRYQIVVMDDGRFSFLGSDHSLFRKGHSRGHFPKPVFTLSAAKQIVADNESARLGK